MKSVWFAILVWGISFCGMAQMKMPRSVLEISELPSARKEAQQKREALVFVMVNTMSTQGFVQEALAEYVSRFRTYGPVLLVRANMGEQGVPEKVSKALEELSGYPRVVVADAYSDDVITGVPYLKIEERDDKLKEHRRIVFNYLKEQKKRPRPASATP